MKILLEDTTDNYGIVLIGYMLQNEKGKYLVLRHMFTSEEAKRYPEAIALFREQMRRNVNHFNRIPVITEEFFNPKVIFKS